MGRWMDRQANEWWKGGVDRQADRRTDSHTGVVGGGDWEGPLISRRVGGWMGRYRSLRGEWMDR